MTFICICLFIGAMGKSAQVPLHVWLPDSMEGPTPISALIHAATMVTAGIFMVARMSPLFEFSEYALNFVLFIGATTALFMGFLGIINNDIKRVVAYSTLSQLGYMTVALGVSAYSFGIFHLMTHAFFKALLFLAAGSVIIGMHHEQDMRKMGGLAKYMTITAITCWIGTLALIGTPFFSGFYSKDLIIDAVKHQHHLHPDNCDRDLRVLVRDDRRVRHGVLLVPPAVHDLPRQAALGRRSAAHAHARSRETHETHAEAGHGAHDAHAHDDHAHDDHGHGHHGGPPLKERWDDDRAARRAGDSVGGHRRHAPSSRCCSAAASASPSSSVRSTTKSLHEIGESVGDWWHFALHALSNPVFWLMVAGVLLRLGAVHQVAAPARTSSTRSSSRCAAMLENKYYFDWFNENVLAAGSRLLGKIFWKVRRPGHHRQGRGRWLGEHDRLHLRHRAPRAERLPLFLCVLDGHRTRRHARLVPDARLI